MSLRGWMEGRRVPGLKPSRGGGNRYRGLEPAATRDDGLCGMNRRFGDGLPWSMVLPFPCWQRLFE